MIGADRGGVTVRRNNTSVGKAQSPIYSGDRILSIAGERITDLDDVRLAMLDRRPGEQVWLELERRGTATGPVRISTFVELI